MIVWDLSECSHFDSWFTPKISYTNWNIADWSWNTLQNFSEFNCSDLAKPYIATPSSISIPDNSFIQIDFSESLTSNSTAKIKLFNWDTEITWTASRVTSVNNKYDSLIFTPSNNLSSNSGNYILKITNVEDWS